MTEIYRTDNIMVMFGGDFYFDNLTVTLTLFEIIEYFKAKITDFKVNIATPSEYFDAIFKGRYEFPVFGGDFFPLIDDYKPYMQAWTGYFTTRPYLKSRIASVQRLVRSAEILQSLVNSKPFAGYQDSVGTHHDAFTGTCTHPVFLDYIRRLDEDYEKCLSAISESFFTVLEKSETSTALMVPYKVMVLFNPINKNVKKILSFISNTEFVTIMKSSGKIVQAQSVPFNQSFEIFFESEIQPFGFQVLFISENSADCDSCSFPSSVSYKKILRNGKIGVEFENGLISKILKKDQIHFVNSMIMGYNSSNGGPYIFYPETAAFPIGELIFYEVYSGDLLQIAESHFRYNSQIYVQRVILPNHSSTFKLKFKLFAELGLEVFLRFSNPNHSYDWFYTFNSADIMSRHPYPNETFLIGENYFPINAGLIVESQDTYLHIYPNFPLGGGMPDQEHFELHLHRNPDKNDHLGINGYYGEYSPVEHEFLMGFTDLKPKKIWKKYLENKAAPQVFFKSLGNFLTEDFEAAEKTQSKWEYKSKYSLINEDKCGYVSSIMTRENDMICRVMNICDKPITPEFENFAVEEELNTLGGQIEQRQKAVANGILEFTINDNSAKNYVQYPTSDEDGLIQPFHLNTYKIKKISE